MGFSKVPNLHNFFSMQHHFRVFEDMGKYELANPKYQLALRAARSFLSSKHNKSTIQCSRYWGEGEKLCFLLTFFLRVIFFNNV